MTKRRSASEFRPVGFAATLPTVAMAAVLPLLAGPALAASGSWSATTSGTWSDAANWTDGTIASGAGFTGTFASDITSDTTVTLDSNRTLNTVVFGDADPATTGTWNIVSLQATSPLERLTLAPVPADATGTATATVNGSVTATITAPLSVPNGVFVKNGTGTLILPNTLATPDPNRNMFGARTSIMEGTLQIASDFSLGGQPGSYKPDQLMISGGGTLRTNGALTLGNNRGVTIGVGGGTLSVNGGLLTYAGRFSGVGETLTTTGAGGISLRNTSGSPTEVNWDLTGAGSRIFFRNTNALGVGSVRVRNAVRLVSEISPAGVVTNPITVDSGGGLTARSGAATFADVVLPAAGSVILNKDDARTFGLTIFSNTDLTGDLTVDTSQGGATNPVGDVTLTGVFSGTGGLVKAGTGESGRLILAGDNTYSGSTTVTTGTLFVNGNQSAATGPVLVATGATLGGTGTVGGATAIATGATLSPGASPGTLSFTQGLTLAAGGNYNWQMVSATGTAGAAEAWDLLSVGGSLAIDATAADPFRINLWTLSSTGPDVSGPAANFDPTQPFAWTIASAAGGVSGFAADKFLVDTAAVNGTGGFANAFDTGTFAVNLTGNDLQLVFSPGGSPTTDIVIDVPSGSQTQAAAGYPTIAVADSVTKIGAGTVVFDAANAYTGPTTVSAGTLEVAAADALGSSAVTVDTGATLAIAAGTTMRSPSVIVDGGTLTGSAVAVNDSTGIPSLAINAGTVAGAPAVSVGTGGRLSLPQDARVVAAVGSLAVTETSGGGLVDLGGGQVSVAAGGTTPAEIRADIIAGRNGGAWTGTTGITSSTAAASGGTRTVGYIAGADGSARVSFAAAGDVDLTGTVDVFDLVAVNSSGKYGNGTASVWSQGDFNYDGVTNVFDLVGINTAGTYGRGNYFPAAPTNPTAGSVAAVPEPGCLTILLAGTGFACLLNRLRRR